MPHQRVGLFIIGLAAVLALVGVLVWSGALSWFGRLPGDIRIENERTRVFIPITSMLLVSIALSAILALVRRLL